MKNYKCMKDLDLFQALNNTEKQQIIKLAKGRRYAKGDRIFAEGDPADTIFLVRYGKVLLYKCSEEGKEIALDILEENDIIGENTIFDEMFQTLNARALEETFVCRCYKNDFVKLLKNPEISIKLIKALTDRLNSYTNSMSDMAFCDVKNRVLNTLVRLSRKYGTVTPEGTQLTVRLSHEDIAHLVNASRVMVTNSINALRQEGRIISHQRRFILPTHHGDKVAAAGRKNSIL
ncbi:Crp/Fnr family transcriptional regulator [Oscillospiraceae bacterium WX1]